MVCNLHQVDYAREFGDRIVGLAQGRMVYDGSADALDEAALQAIYHTPPQTVTPAAPQHWQHAIPAGGLL
ncbi:phosphonate/organophosphate ester transporter subunit [compost metagenome]